MNPAYLTEMAAPAEVLPTELGISQYLATHPDFFVRHPHLLEVLHIPHAVPGAVSLLERQIQQLRRQKTQLEGQLQGLLESGRENERRLHGLHQIALRLFGQTHIETLLHELALLLIEYFHAAYIAIRLEDHFHSDQERGAHCYLPLPGTVAPPGVLFVPPGDPVLTSLHGFIHVGQAVCGAPKPEMLQAIYDTWAEHVHSSALIPLHAPGVQGVMAIGSADPKRFHPELSGLFLTYLGRLISLALRPHARP